MSEWITDRRPTAEDAHNFNSGYVWVTTEHGIVLRQAWVDVGDRPWMPIARPEPYVKPKRYIVKKSSTGDYDVYRGNERCYAIELPTREAAERIAAIYEEVMP